MTRKKSEKQDFSNLEPLSQNPFAALGQQLGIASPSSAPKPAASVAPAKPSRAMLLIRVENRKKGKQVTCVYHLGNEAADLLKKLKTKLGTGGTLGEKALELQGDHRQAVSTFFEAEGYKVRTN